MTQLTDKIWSMDVPSMAFGLIVNNYADESELVYMLSMSDISDDENAEEKLITKPLPPGSYRFLFTTKAATEEDARKVVRELPVGARYENYNGDYPVWYHTGKESLRSLLRSKGLDPKNNYAIIEKLSSDE